MSNYTTQVRYICETLSGLTESVGYASVNEVIETARPKIFDFEYPIFDENYKGVLETKILKHFYTREIGLETYGLWKLKLETRLNEIMPYYNKLYESELLTINPLYTVNYERNRQDSGGDVRTIDEQNNGTTERTNEENLSRGGTDTKQFDVSRGDTLQTDDEELVTANETTSGTRNENRTEDLKNRYSDTPQGALSDLESNVYMTNATLNDNQYEFDSTDKTTGDSETRTQTVNKHVRTGQENHNEVVNYGETNKRTETGGMTESGTRKVNDSVTTTRQYIESYVGNNSGKSESALLQEFRTTFLNIDMMVIDNLFDLFMLVW